MLTEKSDEGKVKLHVLPTGKPHISYSEFSDWYSCGTRHKLKYIDKIQLESDSIHTIYGQIIHDALEERILFTKGVVDKITSWDIWAQKFDEAYKAFINDRFILTEEVQATKTKDELRSLQEEKKKIVDLGERFVKTFELILENVNEWINNEFGEEWEPLEAEVEIYEPLSDKEDEGYFKGFIDLVIKTPKYNRAGKKVPGKFVYWILDWKTTDWGWTKENKSSFKKQAQLLCYKNYYSKIKNIPLEDIQCGWILVKRKPKKGELPFELIKVPSSETKVNEAIFLTRTMITSLHKELYFKNYAECLYCVYRPTEHCTLIKKKKP